jgi:hypothetical protein
MAETEEEGDRDLEDEASDWGADLDGGGGEEGTHDARSARFSE